MIAQWTWRAGKPRPGRCPKPDGVPEYFALEPSADVEVDSATLGFRRSGRWDSFWDAFERCAASLNTLYSIFDSSSSANLKPPQKEGGF